MKYDKTKYKIWTWKNPMMLHWIINPGLVINELILGQRVPKVMLIERNSNKPLAEKGFIPCPHCNMLHSGLKWSHQNHTAFKNWFGLYCDNCGKIIPCLTNLTSYVILAVTFPFWYFFKDKWKSKWLKTQKEKFSKPLLLVAPKFIWWQFGLSFGLFMYVFMTIVFPLIEGEKIAVGELIIGIPVWVIGGLLFGYISKGFFYKKKTKAQTE